jgi:hypothetical protein
VQVLKIVYLGGETKGGFFPQGTEGGLSPEASSAAHTKLHIFSVAIVAAAVLMGLPGVLV